MLSDLLPWAAYVLTIAAVYYRLEARIGPGLRSEVPALLSGMVVLAVTVWVVS